MNRLEEVFRSNSLRWGVSVTGATRNSASVVCPIWYSRLRPPSAHSLANASAVPTKRLPMDGQLYILSIGYEAA